MNQTRRDFLRTAGVAAAAMSLPRPGVAAPRPSGPKKHIVTLSFDDGFAKSFSKTAEIYEKHGLAACLNVIATGQMTEYQTSHGERT